MFEKIFFNTEQQIKAGIEKTTTTTTTTHTQTKKKQLCLFIDITISEYLFYKLFYYCTVIYDSKHIIKQLLNAIILLICYFVK